MKRALSDACVTRVEEIRIQRLLPADFGCKGGREPHGQQIHAVAQWRVLHSFAPLGRAISGTPLEARSNEVTFGGLRQPWPTAGGIEPAPSRTSVLKNFQTTSASLAPSADDVLGKRVVAYSTPAGG